MFVDTAHTYLYYVLGDGKAMRYGIGVGREGFTWAGTEAVTRKAEWPDWTPPQEMIAPSRPLAVRVWLTIAPQPVRETTRRIAMLRMTSPSVWVSCQIRSQRSWIPPGIQQ